MLWEIKMGLYELIICELFPDGLTEGQRAGIMMNFQSCWEVTEIKHKHLSLFFKSLIDLVPAGSILCIEGTNQCEEVKSFLEANKIQNITKVQLFTSRPEPNVSHVPCDNRILSALYDLAEIFTVPEICDHIHIYSDRDVLLEWFDAFSRPLYISKKISEESVKTFCEKFDCFYSDASIPDWPWLD